MARSRAMLGIDPKQPLVATDPRAEAEAKVPYKGTHFEGAVEAEFLYATLLSTDLLPFGHFDFRPVLLPLVEDAQGYKLLDGHQARSEGFLRLAEWLERAEVTWARKRKEKAGRMNIYERLDLQRGLTGQDPKARYVVIYPKSATFLCGAVVRTGEIVEKLGEQEIVLQRFVADYVTYFFETKGREEAEYLSAVLNSPTVDALVKPMQARGLWGPRDITKKVWELPIPEFGEKNRKHARLAEIARASANRVRELQPTLKQEASIGRARTTVRQALREELQEIDSIVKELLK